MEQRRRLRLLPRAPRAPRSKLALDTHKLFFFSLSTGFSQSHHNSMRFHLLCVFHLCHTHHILFLNHVCLFEEWVVVFLVIMFGLVQIKNTMTRRVVLLRRLIVVSMRKLESVIYNLWPNKRIYIYKCDCHMRDAISHMTVLKRLFLLRAIDRAS